MRILRFPKTNINTFGRGSKQYSNRLPPFVSGAGRGLDHSGRALQQRIAICSSILSASSPWKGRRMRYLVPTLILACSAGFARAGGAPDPPAGRCQFRAMESCPPGNGNPDPHHKTEKAPISQGEPAAPVTSPEPAGKADVPDSPADAEEDAECDDCEIAEANPRPTWPITLARTLWGLFFVGHPRRVPKARIRGVTVRK